MPKEFKISIETLEKIVERMKNQEQFNSMRSVGYVTIKEYPNGKQYIQVEQPCHYAECNSAYHCYDEME